MPHGRGGGQAAAGADGLAVLAGFRTAINVNNLLTTHWAVSGRIVSCGPI